MEWCDQVLYARTMLNISQTELAKQLNVSYATVSRWENKRTMPTRKQRLAFQLFCESHEIRFPDSTKENQSENEGGM